MRPRACGLALVLVVSLLRQLSAGPVVLDDFEDVTGWKVRGRGASVEKADSAAVGQGAIRVRFPGMAYKRLPGRSEWSWNSAH